MYRFEGVDVESRLGWRGQADEGFPETEQVEEKFDFFWAEDVFDAPHGVLADGAIEGIGAPAVEDAVAPQGARGSIGGFGWGGADGNLGLRIGDFGFVSPFGAGMISGVGLVRPRL